jgi:hypothetical protein
MSGLESPRHPSIAPKLQTARRQPSTGQGAVKAITGEFIAERPSLEAFAGKLMADARAWNAEHEPAESSELPPPDENLDDSNERA